MNDASCLCGSVRWELEGPLLFLSHCHCSRCRKSHGVAFASYAMARADRFRLRGEEHVAGWESSTGLYRRFCRRCGSRVPAEPVGGRVFLPAGNFDSDPGIRPMAHIFAASKAPWYEIRDALPRFDAFPPGVDAPVIPDRAAPEWSGGPRGGCLCGDVAYVLESKPLRARNCHCGRCRKARSAAHASNLFTAVDGVRFVRGGDLLEHYKVPDAQHFTQVFCRRCGSSLPRIDRGRGLAVVPMGGLDDDPGIRPQEHIFVGSKAPWFEIADDLPRYDGYPPPA